MSKLPQITPVLPSANIQRDIQWYNKYIGFQTVHADTMYAVLRRDELFIHLQWHADTPEDPLLGGSVIKIFVDKIEPWLEELVQKTTVEKEKIRRNTPWGTHEFGFYDLNQNAIFFVQSL